MRPLHMFIITALLTAASVASAQAQPRHIYRDGQYFFCPSPDYDPCCRLPNDYSVALNTPPPSQWRPPEYRPGLPTLVPVQGRLGPDLGAAAERAIRNALRPRYRKPPELTQPAPNLDPAAPPQTSMEEEREYIIRQGEEHCRKFPQDTEVCHPPKPQ